MAPLKSWSSLRGGRGRKSHYRQSSFGREGESAVCTAQSVHGAMEKL
ncbi:hypothetical protein CCACVL1_15911 [Corchorus capsularis]|uniref:Uncharacterized protein n=1 Tax=Corchorus capsularis TaxID=210143 RepID=A0A1R3I0K0_COCAP|nr:hypothetical protein CCACVL1_15911 [Corchorus capsularis]